MANDDKQSELYSQFLAERLKFISKLDNAQPEDVNPKFLLDESLLFLFPQLVQLHVHLEARYWEFDKLMKNTVSVLEVIGEEFPGIKERLDEMREDLYSLQLEHSHLQEDFDNNVPTLVASVFGKVKK